MAVIVADRVTEQTATVGTGSFALLGAYPAYRPFSAVCAIGDTFYYTAIAVDASGVHAGQWETGLGTYSAANTITRSVRASSSANALVDFAAGLKQISIAQTAAAIVGRTSVSVKDFGAIGDGVTDDTLAMQAAFQFGCATGVSIFVPSGTFMVDTYNVAYAIPRTFNMTAVGAATFTLFGTGAGSVIKLLNGAVESSFREMFIFRPTTNMDLIEVRDLFVDNNARGSEAEWLAAGGGAVFQQAHTFRVEVPAGVTVKQMRFQNVVIKDPAADGFNCSSAAGGIVNTYIVANCSVIDRTRFRSDIQFSTMPLNTIITGFRGTRIEFEPNTQQTVLCTYSVSNSTVENIDFAGFGTDQSTRLVQVKMDNVTATVWAVFSEIEIHANNCRLHSPLDSRFNWLCVGSTFTNTTFICPYTIGTNTIRGITNYWTATRAVDLLFDNCRFEIDSTDPAISPTGFLLDLDMATPVADLENYKTTVRNCWFDNRAAYSVNAARAGRVYLENNDYGGKTAAINYSVTVGKSVHLTVDGGRFHRVTGVPLRGGWLTVDQVATLAYLILTGDWKGATSAFATSSGSSTSADAANQLQSNRRLVATALPAGALRGDIVEIVTPTEGKPDAYRCTASSSTAATYSKTRQAGALKNTTANRPTGLGTSDNGTFYLDTTLKATGEPLWWNGSAWVTVSLSSITGTLAEFNTAITDNDILPISGGVMTGALEMLDAAVSGTFYLTRANDTDQGAGQITLLGAVGNRIDFNSNGGGAPAFTTRSLGTKLVLSPGVAAAAVDYGLGIESNAMWFSVSTTAKSYKFYGGTTLALTVTGAGAVTAVGAVTGAGGIGYATGSGGTVVQATSKATGVTLDKLSGQITLNAAALAADTSVSFTLTDSQIALGDRLILNHVSGGTFGAYMLDGRSAAGSATISVRNLTAASLSEAIVIGFAVIKAVTA